MEHWQVALLVLSVPFQYWVVHYSGSSELQRVSLLSKTVVHIKQSFRRLLEVLQSLLSSSLSSYTKTRVGIGESAALEVLEHRRRRERAGELDAHFGLSYEPRVHRTADIHLRVGQVIRHRRWGYHGVIVGWDWHAKAPSEWLEVMHAGQPQWRLQPNYAVLVHTQDRQRPQRTYVPQENLEVVGYFEVQHPLSDEYFEAFDGNVYIPRPWLRTIYPID